MALSKAGLEVYTTEPIEDPTVTPIGNVTLITGGIGAANLAGMSGDSLLAQNADQYISQMKSEVGSDESGTEEVDPQTNFVLQNGETLSVDYIGELYSDSFESDYQDISANSSVSVPSEYLKHFFKGKKCCLKKGWGILRWDNEEDNALMGFITELTWNRDKIDIKISGMDKLMDVEAEFEFTQTRRSEVVRQIIEASGLKAKVDATGLIDDIIDFSTKSSSGEDESGESTGSASLDAAVEEAIKGKKTPLDKAKAIDKKFKNHVFYSYYWDVHHPDLEEAWKNAHLNCADGANVLCAMFIKGGLKAVIVHVPDHYIVKVTIDGKAYYTDNAAADGAHTTRPFGEVWRGNTSGTVVGTRISA